MTKTLPALCLVPRRRFLLLTAIAPLAGCGFELRQAPDFAFKTLYVVAPENSSLGNELRRAIAASGKVQVIREASQLSQAEVILDLLQDQREREVSAYTSTGQARELRLRVRVRIRLRGKDGRELIPSTPIVEQREVSYNETQALSKEAEEALLYRDMQSDVVQQTMRRLAAVREI